MTTLAAGDTRPTVPPTVGRANGVHTLGFVGFRVCLPFILAIGGLALWSHHPLMGIWALATAATGSLVGRTETNLRRAYAAEDAMIRRHVAAARTEAMNDFTRLAEERVQVEQQAKRTEENRAAVRRERMAADWEARLDLATPAPGTGYLYVIGYSTGVVKVGQTNNPRRRFSEHRRDAGAFGAEIVNFWLSTAHINYLHTEAALISRCMEVSSYSKREYFHEIDWATAVGFATQLTSGRTS